MGDWIVCTHCFNLVPHYETCDVCKKELPELSINCKSNTNKICNGCGEEINAGEEYCWRCKN